MVSCTPWYRHRSVKFHIEYKKTFDRYFVNVSTLHIRKEKSKQNAMQCSPVIIREMPASTLSIASLHLIEKKPLFSAMLRAVQIDDAREECL